MFIQCNFVDITISVYFTGHGMWAGDIRHNCGQRVCEGRDNIDLSHVDFKIVLNTANDFYTVNPHYSWIYHISTTVWDVYQILTLVCAICFHKRGGYHNSCKMSVTCFLRAL